MTVTQKSSREAVTHYRVIERYKGYTHVELTLETGRTHQIRCHMSHIGHPLLGDDLYGGSLSLIDRQALHCGEMSFIHPVSGEKITVTAPVPEDMQGLIDKISV